MAGYQYNQARPKYQYIFDVLLRADMAAGTIRVSVVSEMLVEARQALKGKYTAAFYRERVLVQPASLTGFTFLFLAVSRASLQDKPHREEVIACSEYEARKLLAGRFVLCFAGCIPPREVRHV